MVQNVAQTPQMPQAAQAPQKKGGLGSSIAQTATIAIPGAVMGGGVGGVMALFPPNKNCIKKEIVDVFEASAKDEIKSVQLIDLLKRADLKGLKGKTGDELSGAVDELIKNLPKNDELIKLAKKAAKNKNAIKLVRNGAMFGMISMLLVNLIQSRKKPE